MAGLSFDGHRAGIFVLQKLQTRYVRFRIPYARSSALRVRYGYRRIHILLRRESWVFNRKKLYLLYQLEGLLLRLKRA
jgi:transposase InsO family protein